MTTKEDLANWFDQGVRQKARWMLVVCDTFDHEDYPVFFSNADECLKRYKEPGEMQRVMECYDLEQSKAAQIMAARTWNLPKATS